MFTLFILGIVLFVFKLVLFAVRAAWSITKVLVFIIGIPLMLLVQIALFFFLVKADFSISI